MTAYLLQEYELQLGQDRSYVVEQWHVPGVQGWESNNGVEKVLNQVPGDVFAGPLGPPPDPNLPGVICKSKSIKRRWPSGVDSNNVPTFDALVHVVYDSAARSTYSPQSMSLTTAWTYVDRPCWTRFNIQGAGGNPSSFRWHYHEDAIPRAKVRVAVTRYPRTASVTGQVRAKIISRIGQVFFLNTVNPGGFDPGSGNAIPFLFVSPSIVSLSNGLTRIVYLFETSTPIQGVAIGGLPGFDVEVPPLRHLDEWIKVDGGAGTPFDIGVDTWEDRYVNSHEDLPFL